MNQKKIGLAACPYCGKKVSFINSLFLKNKGEYTCQKCGCIANISFNRIIYAITSITCLVALIIVILYSFLSKKDTLWGILYVIIPFVIFYCLVPFFMILVPSSDKSLAKKVIDKKKSMTNTQSIHIEQQKNSMNTKKQNKPEKIDSTAKVDISNSFTQSFNSVKNEHKNSIELAGDFAERFKDTKNSLNNTDKEDDSDMRIL